MGRIEILKQIDSEISTLQRARTLLSSGGPKKKGTVSSKAKRVMSPETRKRIGDAQRKRWAKQKQAAK